MIKRRTFIGTLAICLAAPIIGNSIANDDKLVADQLTSLYWNSDPIQVIPAKYQTQPPVVTGISIQPGGDLLAIVGDDHTVNIYDRAQSKFTHQLSEHRDWVRSAKFSPAGKMLATAGNDRTIRLWNTDNLVTSDRLASLDAAVFEIEFSPDGNKLAAVGFDETLRLYDVDTKTLIKSFRCPCADMHSIAFSPNGELIAAGGRNSTVRVWTINDGQMVTEYKMHRKRIRAMQFVADWKIASCGDDCLVCITDIANQNKSVQLQRHGGKLYDIEVLSDGTMATAGSDNLIYLWNLETLSLIGVLKGHTGTVSCLDSDKQSLLSGSFDTYVRTWSLERNAKADDTKSRFGLQWEPRIK